jgi:hypothetical protein
MPGCYALHIDRSPLASLDRPSMASPRRALDFDNRSTQDHDGHKPRARRAEQRATLSPRLAHEPTHRRTRNGARFGDLRGVGAHRTTRQNDDASVRPSGAHEAPLCVQRVPCRGSRAAFIDDAVARGLSRNYSRKEVTPLTAIQTPRAYQRCDQHLRGARGGSTRVSEDRHAHYGHGPSLGQQRFHSRREERVLGPCARSTTGTRSPARMGDACAGEPSA